MQFVERLVLSLEAGLTPHQALASLNVGPGDQVPIELARGLEITRKYGASLLPNLRHLLDQSRSEQAIQEELASEFVAPKATIRMVSWLPVVAVLLAVGSGFDLLSALRQPVTLASILVGLFLVWISKRWSQSILRKAMPRANSQLASLGDFLMALSAGLTVRQAKDELELPPAVFELISEELALCRKTGAGVAWVLRGRLAQLTQQQFEADRNRVRQAGVQLALPLGVALLPALVFLVVIPMFTATSINNVSL
ncbi:MAG: hypothetical protein ACKOOD_05140 [Microbacteriaceae bacterium]